MNTLAVGRQAKELRNRRVSSLYYTLIIFIGAPHALAQTEKKMRTTVYVCGYLPSCTISSVCSSSSPFGFFFFLRVLLIFFPFGLIPFSPASFTFLSPSDLFDGFSREPERSCLILLLGLPACSATAHCLYACVCVYVCLCVGTHGKQFGRHYPFLMNVTQNE